MTRTPPQKPQKPVIRQSREGCDSSNEANVPKPYKFVPFPNEKPNLQRPIGHDKYDNNRLHGTLFITLRVKTSLHISTGVVAMGSDIGSRVSLIKTMVQGSEQKLIIQGSSLKGCIRSVYEAITKSCICKTKAKSQDIPDGYQECKIDIKKNKVKVCHACQIFGAMNWQGLIDFSDANCESSGFSIGFMPSLHEPKPKIKDKVTKEYCINSNYFDQTNKVAGRKFYYHFAQAIEKSQNQGIAVQQAAKEYTFTTVLHFRNLKPEELGTLLIVLGQDDKYPIALKVGGGKPIGMGTMTVEITKAQVLQNAQELRNRYSSYSPTNDTLSGENLRQFINKQIQAAHSSLIQTPQLQELAEILRYPTNRQPPEGMY